MFFIEIRLAVRLATQPFSNSIRALVISGEWLITIALLADMCFTFDFTTLSMTSISCIIRSSTTGTSVPRGLNSAKRCASINIGSCIWWRTAVKAGLKRSTCPTCPFTWWASAKAIICSASSTVVAIGFSIKRCLPALMIFSAQAKWLSVGVTTSTISQAAMRASTLSKR